MDTPTTQEKVVVSNAAQMVQNALMLRSELLRCLIDHKREINKECGYPERIDAIYCREMYDREGIAKRVVQLFPQECWKKDPEVVETEDELETEFEKSWEDLVVNFNLFALMQRADILSGIGSYGIIMFGIDDGLPLNAPVRGVPLDGSVPKRFTGTNKLLYLRVFDETSVDVAKFEVNPNHPRFGQPKLYNVNFINYGNSVQVMQPISPMPTSPTPVHWTRVIHLADNKDSSEVYGVPRMVPVANRLYDLRKVLSSSGEMFWKGGFPGISFEVNPDLQTVATMDKDAMREEFQAYQEGLQRYLALVGVSAKSLQMQVADPTNHFTTHLKAIAVSLGVPYRIFLGTEEAQLAGAQDASAWNERIGNRQTKYCFPCIIKPLVMRLMMFGVLKPIKDVQSGIKALWPDMHTPSELDQATVAKDLATAMGQYISSGADVLMPPKQFLTHVMNFDDETADAILLEAQKYIKRTMPPAPGKQPPGKGKGQNPQFDELHPAGGDKPPKPGEAAPGGDKATSTKPGDKAPAKAGKKKPRATITIHGRR